MSSLSTKNAKANSNSVRISLSKSASPRRSRSACHLHQSQQTEDPELVEHRAVSLHGSIPMSEMNDRMFAHEYLRSLLHVQEVLLTIDFQNQDEEPELLLTPNLVCKIVGSAKPLSALMVGDQVLQINGRIPRNNRHAHKLMISSLPELCLLVGRVTYKEPIPEDRAENINLKRRPGISYFLATVHRSGTVNLGLSVRLIGGKVMVCKTLENSLSAYVYIVGDFILDINGEQITDVDQLRRLMVKSIVLDGKFSTIVERFEPTSYSHNVRWPDRTVDQNVDPLLANDVYMICQREIVRHRHREYLKAEKDIAQQTVSILKTPERIVPMINQEDTSSSRKQRRTRRKALFNSFRSRPSTSRVSAFNHPVHVLDLPVTPIKRRNSKHISINVNNNEQEKILTDVRDPQTLHHVRERFAGFQETKPPKNF